MTSQHDPHDDAVLRPLDGPVTAFDCGPEGKEQTDFLCDLAWDQQCNGLSVTYVLWVKGMLAGYFTVTMGLLPLSKQERPAGALVARLPALFLVQMGIATIFQRQGYGEYLVDSAIALARNLAQVVGCRYVMLDARPNVQRFYEKLGFVVNTKHQEDRVTEAKRNTRDVSRLAVSMRFDLRAPGAPPLIS